MKTSYAILFITTILALSMIPPSFGRVSINNTREQTISINITFANYTDLDGDGFQDDVYAEVEVKLDGSSAYTFEYNVTLTLPSGLSFSYKFIISTNYQSFIIYHYFFDHAIESGWYTLNAEATLNNGGRSTTSNTFVFDPPGGSGGSDPDLVIST